MIASQIFSGAGFGLLVGILMGLSASPVVGVVVSALAVLIAGYFGLKDGKPNDSKASNNNDLMLLNGLRGGCFCFACTIGVLLALYMRTHNYLSPPELTLKDQKARWTELGFTEKEAKHLVLYNKLGILPNQINYSSNYISPQNVGKSSNNGNLLNSTVLFATKKDVCEGLDVDRFQNVSTALQYYKNIHQDALANLTQITIQKVGNEVVRKEIIRSAVGVLCSTK